MAAQGKPQQDPAIGRDDRAAYHLVFSVPIQIRQAGAVVGTSDEIIALPQGLEMPPPEIR